MLVSVIIVTCGAHDHFAACLESVKNQAGPRPEILVIDDSAGNIFYAGALNKGIAASKGECILCLNDDVMLDKDFIREAVRGFSTGEKIGMVSGKVLRPDTVTLDSTGLFLSLFRTARERGYGRLDRGQFEKEGYVFGVTGSAAFYRRSMLEDVRFNNEYFDPDFRMFYEDLDVAWRARNRGWKGYYVPRAIAFHVRGASVRTKGGIGKRYARRYIEDDLHVDLIKNRYLCVLKNESVPGFFLHLPFMLAYDFLCWLYLLLFRFGVVKKFFKRAVPYKAVYNKRNPYNNS
ncbi:MAG: glycosyltransferase [Candidatus Omnitrophota bacterium]|jgi:GT2 family glycosyltransferase